MSDTENTQNQLSNIEAGQIELLTERIISNKPSDAEIIYNKRKHLGLTQKEFADKIGCSLSTIARIERGISPISANTQRKLDALDVQKPKELPLEKNSKLLKRSKLFYFLNKRQVHLHIYKEQIVTFLMNYRKLILKLLKRNNPSYYYYTLFCLPIS